MSVPDPGYVAGQLREILTGVEDVEQHPLPEQYRRLDRAQQQLGEILSGPSASGPKPAIR
ncbi:MAG: hypothetical protein R2722_16950 [Tessaracoccus sp.]